MMTTELKIVEPTYRGILRLATPVVISMLSLTLMGVVDTLVVGRLGTAQLAAVGFAIMLGFNLFSFATGFMSGVTTIVSQSFGARDFSACRAVVWQALFVSVLFGMIYGTLSFFMTGLFRFMRLSPAVQQFGVVYAHWYLLGGFFVVFNQALTSFFQGIGNTRVPMLIAIVANILNAVLAWVLVLGWNGGGGYGVAGAAFATLIANAFSSLLYLYFFQRSSVGRVTTSPSTPLDFSMLKRLTILGLPIGTQMFFSLASFLVFYVFVGWLGDAALAANRIVIQMDHLAFMPIMGIGQAAQVIAGQYIGAREPLIAKRMVNKAILLGTLLEGTAGLVFLVFAEPIVRFFSQDPVVIQLGATVLRFALFWMVFDALTIISMFALRGVGDVLWSMMISLLFGYGVRLPVVYVLAFTWGFGFYGAWFGLIVAFVAWGLTLYIRFAKGVWMKRYETIGRLVPEAIS